MTTRSSSTFVSAALVLTALFGAHATGCVAPVDDETAPLAGGEAEELSPSMAAPGKGGTVEQEVPDGELPEDEAEVCEQTGSVSPVSSKKSSSGGTSPACPEAPAGWTYVGTTKANGDWLYCHYLNPSNCHEFGAWLDASLGPGNNPTVAQTIATSCAGLSGTAQLLCLSNAVHSAVPSPPGECRDFAYLFTQVCGYAGLSCDFEASSTHAWVEVTMGGTTCLVDAYNQIILCH
ncbi:MAG: hypothetical protein R3B70_06315 [Polyangiaceae bacterium]